MIPVLPPDRFLLSNTVHDIEYIGFSILIKSIAGMVLSSLVFGRFLVFFISLIATVPCMKQYLILGSFQHGEPFYLTFIFEMYIFVETVSLDTHGC